MPKEEAPQFEMPPQLGGLPSQPTTTTGQQRQAILNQELQNLTQLSMKQQAAGDEEAVNRTTRDLSSLLMEAARTKVPLSMQ